MTTVSMKQLAESGKTAQSDEDVKMTMAWLAEFARNAGPGVGSDGQMFNRAVMQLSNFGAIPEVKELGKEALEANWEFKRKAQDLYEKLTGKHVPVGSGYHLPGGEVAE